MLEKPSFAGGYFPHESKVWCQQVGDAIVAHGLKEDSPPGWVVVRSEDGRVYIADVDPKTQDPNDLKFENATNFSHSAYLERFNRLNNLIRQATSDQERCRLEEERTALMETAGRLHIFEQWNA